jgi:hypothetical protein
MELGCDPRGVAFALRKHREHEGERRNKKSEKFPPGRGDDRIGGFVGGVKQAGRNNARHGVSPFCKNPASCFDGRWPHSVMNATSTQKAS